MHHRRQVLRHANGLPNNAAKTLTHVESLHRAVRLLAAPPEMVLHMPDPGCELLVFRDRGLLPQSLRDVLSDMPDVVRVLDTRSRRH